MSTSQPDGQHPDQPVQVSPVYLAGRGNPAAIGNALNSHRDWGWTTTDNGQLFVSPHHDVHVAYLPHSRDGGWRVARYHEPLGMPAWSATFSRNTPSEITNAFTQALVECLDSHHRHPWDRGPQGQGVSADGILAERGWRSDDTTMEHCQYSPDGHAFFSRRAFDLDDYAELAGDSQAMWTMHACVNEVNGERWHADFTQNTPLYLVTQTVRAFSSTEPVERTRSAIPERNLPYVTTEPVSEPDSDRLREAALARTPHALPAVPAPAADATEPGRTPPVPFRRR
ncbi:DUF317 domain-containing protein [Streptomyces sp. CA-111067]|uniref:DUF317 domain-containing protein n=1 Tax=Streptomyces sp. CA-111067 TaxID=3240046 RepID=UPI003D97F0AB